MLRRQRAIELVPSSKPLRWRRYDVPQHLAPETSDALRFCAVEGDLELLDRRHRSTIVASGDQEYLLTEHGEADPGLRCPRLRTPEQRAASGMIGRVTLLLSRSRLERLLDVGACLSAAEPGF